ncbi:MAG: terpene cyclase/mutase family protein [Fuerstiella sp.]
MSATKESAVLSITPRAIVGRAVIAVVLSWVAIGSAKAEQPGIAETPAPEIRDAVERALVYLEDRGEWWAEEKGCISCHRNSFQIWAFAEAARLGLDVDRKKLNRWTDRSLQQLSSTNDKGQVVGTLNPDGAAQLLLAYPLLIDGSLTTDHRPQLVKWLKQTRLTDGSWQAAGQLPGQKRPKVETHRVSTLWNELALRTTPAKDDGDESAAVADVTEEKDLSGILTADQRAQFRADADSTEALVVLLLTSTAAAETKALLDVLQSEQNEDGGWGWIRNDESDPMATGQVLYALSAQAADDGLRETRDRAVKWLLQKQNEKGAWPTKGTKQNRRTKVSETATYWGSAWAVIGLLRTL